MTYNINKTNGDLLTSVPDGEVDVSSSIRLIGRNYPGYGEIMGENLISMLENFSNVSPPPNPLVGQIWHNTASGSVYFFDNSKTWVPIETYSDVTRPRLLSIIDTHGDTHKVMGIYAASQLVVIISGDISFVPANNSDNVTAKVTVDAFPLIKAGINLNAGSGYKMVGYVSEADLSHFADNTNTIASELNQSLAVVKTTVDEALRVANSAAAMTKASIGLDKVDNTSDANKPISIAAAAALALKADKATTYTKTEVDTAVGLKANQTTTYTKTETDSRIQSVVGAAPAALDTLAEIAAQLSNDESAAAALTAAVSLKAPLVSPAFSGNVTGISASMVGAYTTAQVDNALALKANQTTTYTKTETDSRIQTAVSGVTSASQLVTANWTVSEANNVLYFKFNGVNKMSLDSSGNIVAAGDITAFKTP
jgi:hypothetical protein